MVSYGRIMDQDSTPHRILLVKIHHMIYPISMDVLHQVFSPHGFVEKIAIVQEPVVWQALIQYESHQCAEDARSNLQRRYIYDACCQLQIEYSNYSELQVNSEDYRCIDFTTSLSDCAPPARQNIPSIPTSVDNPPLQSSVCKLMPAPPSLDVVLHQDSISSIHQFDGKMIGLSTQMQNELGAVKGHMEFVGGRDSDEVDPSCEFLCNLCLADCSCKRYHCQKLLDYDLCIDCYHNSELGFNLTPLDFLCMEVVDDPIWGKYAYIADGQNSLENTVLDSCNATDELPLNEDVKTDRGPQQCHVGDMPLVGNSDLQYGFHDTQQTRVLGVLNHQKKGEMTVGLCGDLEINQVINWSVKVLFGNEWQQFSIAGVMPNAEIFEFVKPTTDPEMRLILKPTQNNPSLELFSFVAVVKKKDDLSDPTYSSNSTLCLCVKFKKTDTLQSFSNNQLRRLYNFPGQQDITILKSELVGEASLFEMELDEKLLAQGKQHSVLIFEDQNQLSWLEMSQRVEVLCWSSPSIHQNFSHKTFMLCSLILFPIATKGQALEWFHWWEKFHDGVLGWDTCVVGETFLVFDPGGGNSVVSILDVEVLTAKEIITLTLRTRSILRGGKCYEHIFDSYRMSIGSTGIQYSYTSIKKPNMWEKKMVC